MSKNICYGSSKRFNALKLIVVVGFDGTLPSSRFLLFHFYFIFFPDPSSSQAHRGMLIHDDVIKWEHFSVLLAFCAVNSPVTGEFPSQRPVTRSFDVFFDLSLNKRLNKQSRRRWFETPSRSWRHSKEVWCIFQVTIADPSQQRRRTHSSDKGPGCRRSICWMWARSSRHTLFSVTPVSMLFRSRFTTKALLFRCFF